MSTMKTITIEFLEEKKTATFKQLWDKVSKELKNDWEEQYPKSSSSDIEKKKIGELYTMLTMKGEFIRDQKDKWTLASFYSFEEVQKMKINVGELED